MQRPDVSPASGRRIFFLMLASNGSDTFSLYRRVAQQIAHGALPEVADNAPQFRRSMYLSSSDLFHARDAAICATKPSVQEVLLVFYSSIYWPISLRSRPSHRFKIKPTPFAFYPTSHVFPRRKRTTKKTLQKTLRLARYEVGNILYSKWRKKDNRRKKGPSVSH